MRTISYNRAFRNGTIILSAAMCVISGAKQSLAQCVTPAPITGSSILCPPSYSTSLADATPGGVWSTSDGSNVSIDAAGTVTGLRGGVAIVTYTVPGGCFVNFNIVDPAITGPATVCSGSSVTMADAYPGGTFSTPPGTTDITITASGVVNVVSGFTGPLASDGIIYTLPVSAGCSTDPTTNINVDAAPAVSTFDVAYPTTNPVCEWGQFGLATSISGGAGGPYTYNWWGPMGVFATKTDPGTSTTYFQAGGFTPSEAGPYSVEVVDYLGCVSPRSSLSVGLKRTPTSYTITTPYGRTPGVAVVLSGSDVGTTYQLNDGWYNVGAPQTSTSGGPLTFTTGGSGHYVIYAVWPTNSCVGLMNPQPYLDICPGCRIIQNPNLSVSTTQADEPLTLVPNPSNGKFTINGSADFLTSAATAKVEIIDMTGHMVLSQDALLKNGSINQAIQLAKNVANGIYQVKLSTAAGSQILRFELNR